MSVASITFRSTLSNIYREREREREREERDLWSNWNKCICTCTVYINVYRLHTICIHKICVSTNTIADISIYNDKHQDVTAERVGPAQGPTAK